MQIVAGTAVNLANTETGAGGKELLYFTIQPYQPCWVAAPMPTCETVKLGEKEGPSPGMLTKTENWMDRQVQVEL